MLPLSVLVYTFSIFCFVIGEQIPLHSPLRTSERAPRSLKVAIVGAGIAGTSAAYHLRDKHPNADLDITIYEADADIGGKIKSAAVYDGAFGSQRVETGAPSFYANDECVQFLIDNSGLRGKVIPYDEWPPPSVGIWNGENLIPRNKDDLKARTWKDWARYAWRYGLSVENVRKWLSRKLPLFENSLGRYEHTDRNILNDIEYNDLTTELNTVAWSFLENLTSTEFLRDVEQAITRAWFGHDLSKMRSIAAFAALNPSTTSSLLNGGNRKLIERLIKLSDVNLLLNHTVTKIERSPNRKYRLIIEKKDHSHSQHTSKSEEIDYDAVIIAAPLEMAKIEFDIGVHVTTSNSRPFVTRHVTHFTSPDSLSPLYFNLAADFHIPSKIYTTNNSPNITPTFFSIEYFSAFLGREGCVLQSENMYRIVTATTLDDRVILELLGHDPKRPLQDAEVHWVHRQNWEHAFLEYNGAAMQDDIEIAESIFYTGASEELVSSLEMSCRMGRRAALLLYYEKADPIHEV